MPPFWLVVKVNEEAVVTYFHCRYELAQPEELLQWRQIHEDLLDSITALAKSINQQMLLKVRDCCCNQWPEQFMTMIVVILSTAGFARYEAVQSIAGT